MRPLAPISVSVYTRHEHLRRCVESLARNDLAPDSVLFIFSDAGRQGDEADVKRVRDYARTVTGFKDVRLITQSENNPYLNMRAAREVPLEEFGRLIRLEDDVIVSKYFLRYLNAALDRYENDRRIFTISAYAPQLDHGQNHDVFLSKDYSAWGFATWKDRQITLRINTSDYYSQILARPDCTREARQMHPKMMGMLRLIEQGKANPGDYKCTAHQFLSGTYSVKPRRSLARNSGFEGSGSSGLITTIFDTVLDDEHLPRFPDALEYDPELDRRFFRALFPESRIELLRYHFLSWLKSLVPKAIILKIKALLPFSVRRRFSL
jgi:hypothetical protein